MPVLHREFVQSTWERTDQWAAVTNVADRLVAHLNEPKAQSLLATANVPGASSSLVQNTFLLFAHELGFKDESIGLFDRYENRAVRPDYFLPLGDTGILMEVERGKTTINNMDFLDFWKCHLCEHAHYLFLMVPQELRQNGTSRPTRPYNAVNKRMSSFFVPRNYTNVRGLLVFGY